jgi:methyl-accepting chemotaxis protein
MRLTIRVKLILAFATVIILSGVTAWLGVGGLSSLNATLDSVLAGPVERIKMAQSLSLDLLMAVRAEKNLILEEANPEATARHNAEILQQRELFAADIDKLDAAATTEGKKRLAALRVTRQQWIENADKLRGLVRDHDAPGALALSVGHGRELVANLGAQVKDYLDLQEQLLIQAKDAASHQYESTRLSLTIATLIALGFGACAAC